MTRSNRGNAGSKYCATDNGLINKHGLSLGSTLGISPRSFRTGMCRPFFCSSLISVPSSDPLTGFFLPLGRRAASSAAIASSVVFMNFWSSSRNCSILRLCSGL